MHCSYKRVHQTLLGNICFDCMLTNTMELKKKRKTIVLCNYATSVTPLFILSTLNACESREICLDYSFTVPQIQKSHPLIGQMTRIRTLTQRQMHTRRSEFLFQPEYSRDRTTFTNLERFDTPDVLYRSFEGFEVWRFK